MKPEFGLDECRTLNIEHWCRVVIHFGTDEGETIEALDEDTTYKYLLIYTSTQTEHKRDISKQLNVLLIYIVGGEPGQPRWEASD
jgi:hypothetical protein